MDMGTHVCAICGDEGLANDHWFLMVENRWEDKLKILHWDEELATDPGVQRACSPAHVQELVVHWMATGGLNYPLARITPGSRAGRRTRTFWDAGGNIDTTGARQIGELAVHRESMKRVLNESPQSLKAILDALLSSLEREKAQPELEVEPQGEQLCPVFREV